MNLKKIATWDCPQQLKGPPHISVVIFLSYVHTPADQRREKYDKKCNGWTSHSQSRAKV